MLSVVINGLSRTQKPITNGVGFRVSPFVKLQISKALGIKEVDLILSMLLDLLVYLSLR